MLGYDMVAVSNTPTAEQIHAIVDRYRTAALPFSGSSVLSDYYSQVPALSIAWGIGRISLPFWSQGGPRVFGVTLPLDADTAFIASVRYHRQSAAAGGGDCAQPGRRSSDDERAAEHAWAALRSDDIRPEQSAEQGLPRADQQRDRHTARQPHGADGDGAVRPGEAIRQRHTVDNRIAGSKCAICQRAWHSDIVNSGAFFIAEPRCHNPEHLTPDPEECMFRFTHASRVIGPSPLLCSAACQSH